MQNLKFPDTNPEHALTFLSIWFSGLEPSTLVSLFGLPSAASVQVSLEDLREKIREDGLDELVFSGLGGKGFDNIYIGVSPLRARPPRGRRGTKNLISQVQGVWMDLDTKEGATPIEDARKLHAYLPPTMVVSTGTGGIHLYWRTKSHMTVQQGEALNKRVRLWAEGIVGHQIDTVHNADRVLRLPGTLRLPKTGESVLITPVELLYSKGGFCDIHAIETLTEAAWTAHTTAVHDRRQVINRDESNALRLMTNNGANRWLRAMTIEVMEDVVNEVPWARILEPMGWEKFGSPDREGRVSWTRPHDEGEGFNPRSAIVDWQQSPNVMSLLTDSSRTGLRRLTDAEIPLTKLRVLAELHYDGSLTALAAVLRQGRDPLG